MSQNAKSSRLGAATIALAAAALFATPALAEKAKLKSMSFDVEGVATTIHAISTDGQTWNKLKTASLQLSGHMKIDTKWPGFVEDVAVVLGHCSGALCESLPLLWSDGVGRRDYNHQTNFSFWTSQIPISSETGIAVITDGDAILSRCNQHLAADGPTKSYSFAHEFHATLVASTEKATLDSNLVVEADLSWPSLPPAIEHTRSDTFMAQVICDPVMKLPTNDVAVDFGEFDVENVKLFLTTYQNQQPGSNPGTVCPALKVTSRAQANQAGPVSLRVWRQKNGGAITSDFVEAWASFDAAKNGYFATHETWEDVGSTSHFQFKTEIVEAGPFGPFDGWKDITVHCTSPGGGGLAPLPPVNPDQPQPQAEWQGEITVADSAGRDKSCPRKGQVVFEALRGGPGDFDYRISCSNGAYFEGVATGFNQGGPNFEAFGAHDLSINRTRSIQCTLQEIRPNGSPVTIAVGSKDFTCNNPAIDPAADDLTSAPRPIPVQPLFPVVIVTPEPKCDRGERLVRGKCVARPPVSILCKPGYLLVGKKCLRKPVIADSCKRDEHRVNGKCVKKPGVSIHCLPGFQQIGKTCVKKPVIAARCKANEQRIKGKCVKKPVVSILCKKGFKLVGKKCLRLPAITKLCGKGEKLLRGKCVEKIAIAPRKTFAAPKLKRNKTLAPLKPLRAKPRRLN